MKQFDAEIDVKKLQATAFKAAEVAKITLIFVRMSLVPVTRKRRGMGSSDSADQGAEKEIRKVIEASFPDHNILGEEFGHKDTLDLIMNGLLIRLMAHVLL